MYNNNHHQSSNISSSKSSHPFNQSRLGVRDADAEVGWSRWAQNFVEPYFKLVLLGAVIGKILGP